MLKSKVMKKLLYWIQNARAYALPQSVLPAIVALLLPVGEEGYSLPLGLLAVLIVAIAHLSMNLFDDYFDFQTRGNEIREELEQQGERARDQNQGHLHRKCPSHLNSWATGSLRALTSAMNNSAKRFAPAFAGCVVSNAGLPFFFVSPV